MKVAVVLGTRPEIIKMTPVIRELERRGVGFFLLHTGQHYSYDMDRLFFDQLQLSQPKYNLEAGSGSHGEQTARVLVGVETVLRTEKPDVTLAEGDTNSVLAAALAAAKLHLTFCHVEAGLRSYDRRMPEEVNRVLADHCADYLFAPTDGARVNLLREGIPEDRVFATGNTVVDAIQQHPGVTGNGTDALDRLGLRRREYCFATVHRQENVDDPSRYSSILEGLSSIVSELGLPVVYPVHPHSRKRMGEFGLAPKGLMLTSPVDFHGFTQLERNARLVLTDSGGVQEEACILGVPCVTLRENTERPETVEVGANLLAGISASCIVDCARAMLAARNGWRNPFGDGRAAERIVSIITEGRHG